MPVPKKPRHKRPPGYKHLVLQLDPGATIKGGRQWMGGRLYVNYSVYDSAGVEIGWTDGNEAHPSFAWGRALTTLWRRSAGREN